MSKLGDDEESDNSYTSDSNFASESDDSDSDEENQRDFVVPIHDYVTDAKNVIFANEDITIANALIINSKLQENLRSLKCRLENLLDQVKNKYKSNEKLLTSVAGSSTDSSVAATKKGRKTFYFCGAPYFKTVDLFSAPSNADYLYRKNVLKEYFPLDVTEKSPRWMSKDKMFLIQGIKEQIIKCLTSKCKDSVRNIKSSTRDSQKRKSAILDNSYSLGQKSLRELYEMVLVLDFTIDWFTISTKHLDGRHKPNECEAIWNGYLMPTINRSAWTIEEEQKLTEIVNEHNRQDWQSISNQIGGHRSAFQCLVHYQSILVGQHTVKNVRWTKEEDKFLIETVEKLRIGSHIPWTSVVEKIPSRTKHQVYCRYQYTLRPGIKRERFTVEEDCILIAAIKEYGKNFHKFPPSLFPGRTLVQIRHRYNNVLSNVGLEKAWDAADDEKLFDLVKQYGQKNWVEISRQLQTHNRVSCRSRYMTICKYLEKNPNSSITDAPRKNKRGKAKVTPDNWMETIIKLKQEGAPIKPDKQSLVRQLRSQGTKLSQGYFDYFKYAYHYEFKCICDPKKTATENNRTACQLLYNRICAKDYNLLLGVTGIQIDMEYISYADREQYDFVLPPNWNTALVSRGLSIMFPYEIQNCARNKPATVKVEQHDALALFKKRLFSLLFSTTLASQTEFINTLPKGKNWLNTEHPLHGDVSLDTSQSMNEMQEYELIDTSETINDFTIDTVQTNDGNFEIISVADDENETNINLSIVKEEGKRKKQISYQVLPKKSRKLS